MPARGPGQTRRVGSHPRRGGRAGLYGLPHRPSLPRRRREKPIGGRLPRDRLLTVDCGQRGRALWTPAHVMDWCYAAHLQLKPIVADYHGV